MRALSPQAEALLEIIRGQFGELLERPVVSVPEAGAVLGLGSPSTSYDWARRGVLPGLLRVTDDRYVVSTVQLVGYLMGELKVERERWEVPA